MQHAAMSRLRQMQENRKMRFEVAFQSWIQSRPTQAESALLPGVRERSYRPYVVRF